MFLDVLKRLWFNLMALGGRRLVALGLTGLTVFLLVGTSGYMLSRPEQEVLYAGLDASDVTRIGSALDDAGIGFDISVGGDAVLVEYGKAAKARMLLAQKGLPRSDSAGYELFDKLGSLGLTTFMQQVTKVRALEGELARTIQLIDGIKAARVHLALRSEGSFRGNGDEATASVIVRADRDAGEHAANAIRHLVASSIPGLAAAQVSVMSADGTRLTSTDDPLHAAPEKLIGLERTVAGDVEARIARTLTPYLGIGNFRISVSAKLNADRRQMSETNFDPNSRVESSVRTIRESGEAQNAAGSAGVSVEQNIPVEETPKGSGDNSSEKKDRKEELTNYEINSKSVSTTSEGYGIERLSVAVVVNRTLISRMLGDNPSADAITAKITELQQLAAAAAGTLEARGDTIAVSAVDFVEEAAMVQEESPGGLSDLLGGNLGNLINAGALVLITLLVLLLGLRPALRTILNDPSLPGNQTAAVAIENLSGSVSGPFIAGQYPGAAPGLAQISGTIADPVLDHLAREVSHGPRDRLSKIVELDPDRAVEVLKQWLNEPAGGTT